ncbi:MAG: hypothetical protein EOM66_00825 [Clostridia bacterium]|nr:hypothetical protein [Clostridia bacterium]
MNGLETSGFSFIRMDAKAICGWGKGASEEALKQTVQKRARIKIRAFSVVLKATTSSAGENKNALANSRERSE